MVLKNMENVLRAGLYWWYENTLAPLKRGVRDIRKKSGFIFKLLI
jgi:hypothetical protein